MGPPLERGAEWAPKEGLINLSTAPMGPLGILLSLYLDGRAGGRIKKRGKKGARGSGLHLFCVGGCLTAPRIPTQTLFLQESAAAVRCRLAAAQQWQQKAADECCG